GRVAWAVRESVWGGPPGPAIGAATFASATEPRTIAIVAANAVATRAGGARTSASAPPNAPAATWASAALVRSPTPGERSNAPIAVGHARNRTVTGTVTSTTSTIRPRHARAAPPATTVRIASALSGTSRSIAITSHAQK